MVTCQKERPPPYGSAIHMLQKPKNQIPAFMQIANPNMTCSAICVQNRNQYNEYKWFASEFYNN